MTGARTADPVGPETASCDECPRPAELVLSYPDLRTRLCRGCTPPGLLPVAESIEADPLAHDLRPLEDRLLP